VRICVALLAFALQALAGSSRPVHAANVARYLGDDKWEWTVFLDGSSEDLARIARVEYTPGANATRLVAGRAGDANRPWAVTGTGYGTMDVGVRIKFTDGSVQRLLHTLQFGGASGSDGCSGPVSVRSRHYQLLNEPAFRKQLYVYVDDIRSGWRKSPFHVTVFSAEPSLKEDGIFSRAQFSALPRGQQWTLMPREEGDSIRFRYNGRFYGLTVLKVNAARGDNSSLLVKVCGL